MIAIAVALAVESLLLATFLIHQPSRFVLYDQPGGMVVNVVGQGLETGAPAPQPRSLAETLFDDVRRRMSPTYVALPLEKNRAPPRTLSEFFGEGAGQTGEAAPVSSAAEVNRLAQLAAGHLGDPRAQASVPRQPVFDKDGKAAPCWRQPEHRLPVRMIVVLDARGALVGRPIPREGQGTPAEQEAMRAMAGCSPYGPPTVAGTYLVVELDFSKARDWVHQVGTTEIR